jgi:hypothetical protein
MICALPEGRKEGKRWEVKIREGKDEDGKGEGKRWEEKEGMKEVMNTLHYKFGPKTCKWSGNDL